MGMQAEAILSSVLDPGERLLWSGRPQQGIVFRPYDLIAVPSGICLGGFPFASTPQGEGIEAFFALPFVVMGLHLSIGRFFTDARRRSKTFYGLTSERVVIVFAGKNRQVESLYLRPLAELSYTEERSGRGTLKFGSFKPSFHDEFQQTLGLPWRSTRLQPSFEKIENVREVYDKISKAHLEAKLA